MNLKQNDGDRAEPLISVSVASRITGVSGHVLRGAVKAGQLRAFKMGEWLRFRRSDLLRYVADAAILAAGGEEEKAPADQRLTTGQNP